MLYLRTPKIWFENWMTSCCFFTLIPRFNCSEIISDCSSWYTPFLNIDAVKLANAVFLRLTKLSMKDGNRLGSTCPFKICFSCDTDSSLSMNWSHSMGQVSSTSKILMLAKLKSQENSRKNAKESTNDVSNFELFIFVFCRNCQAYDEVPTGSGYYVQNCTKNHFCNLFFFFVEVV